MLDVGCGWGEMIITAAKKYGAKATGCTLSKEQFQLVNERIIKENLQDKLDVQLIDYRDAAKAGMRYDKIVSVGMFEHVGKEDIPEYFHCISMLLKNQGLALIHGISGQRATESDGADSNKGTNGFLNKYIFPGGYIPAITEIVSSINRKNMNLIDLESMRRHYELTLDEWHRRFINHWDILIKNQGERFMRMWDIYFQSCAAIFGSGHLDVCQYLIEKRTDNTRPLTREYML